MPQQAWSAQLKQPLQTSIASSDARKRGPTPLYEGDLGYAPHLDRDQDGVACEIPAATPEVIE